MFKKYQHLERFGTSEVQNIELGIIYIFPKIDGTNASLWFNKELKAGSRNRELSIHNDNAGFYNWAMQQENLKKFFNENPNLRLYGEWLVPHSLKTYRENAWRKFYVFDVMDNEDNYIPYPIYESVLKNFNIDFIPPLGIVKNSTYEKMLDYVNNNNYLIEEGKGKGEGIVVKNYDFKNRFGRTTWAKIVTSEFREKHTKEMGASYIEMKEITEQQIVNKYITLALCEKEKAKIEIEYNGFSSKNILQLLNVIYYCLVKEESWQFIKEHKNPTINYKTLQALTFQKIKQLLNL